MSQPTTTYRVWVHGYVDIKAWTPAHAEDIARKGIIRTMTSAVRPGSGDPTEVFVCLTGPEAYSTTEEAPR